MRLFASHPAPSHISLYLSYTPNITHQLDGSAVGRIREILQCVQQVTLTFRLHLFSHAWIQHCSERKKHEPFPKLSGCI